MNRVPDRTRGGDPRFAGLGDNPWARLRLYCFPYAGGGPAAFRPWLEWLPASVELVAVDPRAGGPGHGGVTDLHALAEGLTRDMSPHLDRPYAFFGYSMGALLAFETAVRLQQSGEPSPSLFCVAACRPPREQGLRWSRMSTRELAECLGQVDPGFAQGSAAAACLSHNLDRTRTDLLGCECYVCAHRQALDCPMTVFCADQDPLAPPRQMRGWRSYTRASCVQHQIPGGHFFLFGAARDRLHGLLARELAGILHTTDSSPAMAAGQCTRGITQ